MACCATASPTFALMTRSRWMEGRREAPSASLAPERARHVAAARIMPSLTREASTAMVPRPMPGNTSALFAWAIS